MRTTNAAWILLVCLGTLACGHGAAAPRATVPTPGAVASTAAAAPARASSRPSCGPPVPGSAELSTPGATALFGEIHGSVEIPALFGRIVCAAAATHEVIVGIEAPRDEQPRLDAFLASDGGAAALAALKVGSFWSGEWKDGRSSQAMLALLEQLRALRAAGARLRVACFDVSAGATGDRDRAMAESLLATRAAAPDAVLLVLTGNIHARLRGGLEFAPDLVPMGVSLAAAIPAMQSFDARYGAGTAWVCTGETPADCGAQP